MRSRAEASPSPAGSERQQVPVRVVATLGLAFGTAALTCLPFSFVPFVDGQWPVDPTKNSLMELWVLVSTFVGLGLGFLLLVSSIGCMSREWWARLGMMLWAASSVLWGFVGAYFYVWWLFPSFRPNISNVRGEGPWGGLVFWIIGWVFAAFVLYWITRPAIRAEFERPKHECDAGITNE